MSGAFHLHYISRFLQRSAPCSRRQFPLTISYAITVHKSQGATLSQVVLNIANRDFTPGLTYVAVSRATRLDGILFEEPFSMDAIRKKTDETSARRRTDMERRKDEILQPPQEYEHNDIYNATP